MIKKMRLFPILFVCLFVAASLATWSAWSMALSQSIDPKREEYQPAGKDTVSLETRKQQLAAREAALLARREAALAAREQQLSVDVSCRVRERESSRKKLTAAHEENKLQRPGKPWTAREPACLMM